MKHSILIIFLNLIIINSFSAQCFDPDASIWLDTWTSCQESPNPKEDYGMTHWIQYDFGAERKLSKSWVWNANDPSKLDQGFNLVKIDHSTDGITWTYWGEMNFPKAEGTAIYGGFPGPDLMNIEARFVLITVINNHGDPNCAGIAEVKFNLLPGGELIDPEDPPCAAIEEFEVEELTETEALIFWEYGGDDDEIFFVFEYRTIDGEWMEIETEEPEAFLEDLEPSQEYEFRIGVECGEDLIFSEIDLFTTLGEECAAVEEIWVEWITETEAQIVWEGIEGIDFYFIQYGLENDPEKEELESEFPELLLEDLQPFSDYELLVGVECGEDIIWSEPIVFFTEEDPDVAVPSLGKPNNYEGNLKLFPNPTKDIVEVQLLSGNSDILNYSLTDISGKVILKNVQLISPGINHLTIDLAALPDGVYFLNALTLNRRESFSEKVVKIH